LRGNDRLSKLFNVKLIVSMLIFIALFSSFLLISSNAASVGVQPVTTGEYEITVDSGDTLWSIARSYSDNRTDVRYSVFLIQERNGLKNATIKPGQKLIIPKL